MPSKGPYPVHWRDLVAVVRERSGNRCEQELSDGDRCDIPNGAVIHRDARRPDMWLSCEDSCPPASGYLPATRITLTAAHLCQDSTCDELDHLRHMCNRCHLVFDGLQHARNAAETRRRKRMERGQEAMAL